MYANLGSYNGTNVTDDDLSATMSVRLHGEYLSPLPAIAVRDVGAQALGEDASVILVHEHNKPTLQSAPKLFVQPTLLTGGCLAE